MAEDEYCEKESLAQVNPAGLGKKRRTLPQALDLDIRWADQPDRADGFGRLQGAAKVVG